MDEQADPDSRQDALTRWVLGELRPDEAAAFEQLLAADPELAAEARSLRRAFDLIPYASLTAPPAALRSRLLAAVREQHAGRAGAARRQTWSRWLLAAATLAAVLLAWDGHRLRRELALHQQLTVTLTQPNVLHYFSLSGRQVLARSVGSVVLDLDAKKAAVVIHDLPALPEGEIYRLWALVGGNTVPCGHFNASDEGSVLRQLTIPVDAYTEPVSQLILTRETSAEPSRPLGPTVMVGRAAAIS